MDSFPAASPSEPPLLPDGPDATPCASGDCPLPADVRPEPTVGGQGAFPRSGELPDGVDLKAISAIMDRRLRQIIDFGHTPQADLQLRPKVLPDRAIKMIVRAQEDMHFKANPNWREHAQRHLADAGAMICAAFDYLENGGGE